jgi:feruloyl esterase
MAYLSHFDFDKDAPKIYAEGTFTEHGKPVDYKESAWEFMTPPDADDPKLTELKQSGHKLILYHGQSDGVFSFNATTNWMDKLAANSGGDAGAFARLFAVPGMNHCASGPSTDNFDMLSAIVGWAENGKAPDRIVATVRADNEEVPADWSRERTRPLCPWPKVARYIGGDKEKAESFECR